MTRGELVAKRGRATMNYCGFFRRELPTRGLSRKTPANFFVLWGKKEEEEEEGWERKKGVREEKGQREMG